MTDQVCPFLGTLDANRRRALHVEFPSFENHCFALASPELILLGDQATWCLATACTACSRYRQGMAAHAGQPPAAGAAFVPFVTTAEDAWQPDGARGTGASGGGDFEGFGTAGGDAPDGRSRWGRVGASLIFLTVLLCGSLTAAYSGWEWVTRDLPSNANTGRLDVASAGAENNADTGAAPPAVYVVMTATPVQVALGEPAAGQAAGVAANQAPGQGTGQGTGEGIIPVLPQAVTPTPIRIDPNALAAPPNPSNSQTAAPPADPPVNPEGTPLVDIELLVPTRRPTPVFDVPTSTPGAVETPLPLATDTPTLTPIPLGTPIIIFAPVKSQLMRDECTMVRWNVQNVREVYYENLPMNGQGEREECIKDEDEIYTLLVVLGNGQPQIYTTTVEYLPPTPTVTVTPSFTPEPVFTPTWTPEPPTPTAPPNSFYAVSLSANGSTDLSCAPGQTCEVGLLVTNGGNGMDTVSVVLQGADGLPVQLCRPDGVCSSTSLPINNMGAGNTAYVMARFTVAADAAPQTRGAATVFARSDGSGGGVTSGNITLSATVAGP
jgi:hypothetical protein